METKQATLVVPKETAEIWECLAKIVDKVGEAKKQGLDVAGSVAYVASGSIEPLMVALQGVDKVGAEHKDNVSGLVAVHGYGATLVGQAIAKALA